MIGMIFHYKNNTDSKFKVDYTLWDDFLAIWKLDLLIMIDGDKSYTGRKHTYHTLEEVINNYPDFTFVCLDSNDGVDLYEFEHPEDNVIYIIGDNEWKTSQMPKDLIHVRINTPTDSISRPMRDISAAVCLVYDREMKK